MKRTMKWTLASSACLWLAAGCGAAGNGDGQGVEVRPVEPGPGVLDPARPPADPDAPGVGPNGPDFNVGDDGEAPTQGCQQAQRDFVPNIPTVYLLVDRSATMFDSISDNISAWSALRGGALEVMRELEGNVRFGFAAFSGASLGVVGGVPQCELQVPAVAPALNNYAAISQLYEPMAQPQSSKDTPTVLALAEVARQLREDTQTQGDKYILFVTDGEPDYCDDGNPVCPPDSVVGLLQSLAAPLDATGAPQAPIQTLVFGITSPTATIREDILQAFANAGAGVPTLPAAQNANDALNPNFIYDQCSGVPGWANDFAATGKPAARGQTIGTYVADPTLAGSAPVFRPDPTNQAALTAQLRTALASVKSCTFDLGEDGVEVDLTRRRRR
jgi:hypothetical protein